MKKDKLAIVLLFMLINSYGLYSQNNMISKDKAIEIALKNGLPVGFSEYDAELQGDTMWIVKSLLCDDGDGQKYQAVLVNSLSGKVITDTPLGYVTMHMTYGEQVERTVLNTNNINFDILPIIKSPENRKLTCLNENESNPAFSDNDKLIAFQYGFRKIGIISIQGEQFQQICDACLYPQWLDNEWIVYFKDTEHIYKKNINTAEEIRITEKPYRYEDYQLSPEKDWIIYQSSEMWPTQDSLGRTIIYSSINGQGENLCMISVDGKIKKYFNKDWNYYYKPTWTPNNDSVFFYISAKKYLATDFSTEIIKFNETDLLQNLSLSEYRKIKKGSFPFIYDCQVLEVNANTLAPIRFLIEEQGRYRDLNFSNNKEYLVYSKTDKNQGDYSLWIMKIN